MELIEFQASSVWCGKFVELGECRYRRSEGHETFRSVCNWRKKCYRWEKRFTLWRLWTLLTLSWRESQHNLVDVQRRFGRTSTILHGAISRDANASFQRFTSDMLYSEEIRDCAVNSDLPKRAAMKAALPVWLWGGPVMIHAGVTTFAAKILEHSFY